MQFRPVSHRRAIGYTGCAAPIEKQEETRNAPEIAFAWRNERRPKTSP
jgi:hypothetical protein